MHPAALRALQFQHGGAVPRVGPYGLPQPAAARFGWDRVRDDSAFAHQAARTLWLDYYCVFGDSICADWALIASPRTPWEQTALLPWHAMPLPTTLGAVASPPIVYGAAAVLPPLVVPEPPKDPEVLRITVRSGDNFGILMKRYPGVTLKELYAANRGSDRIFAGQVLKIAR